MSTESTKQPGRLGLRGNFTLLEKLKETTEHYGISVSKAGKNEYLIAGNEGSGFSIDEFCPSYITHKNGVMNQANVKAFLDYLHQPIRSNVEAHSSLGQEPNPEDLDGNKADKPKKKEIRAHNHDRRTQVHRLMRFAATGSVEIPADSTEELEKETAECHATTEQAMRDADTWRREMEVGNTEDTQASIPSSRFDPENGFAFKLHENVLHPDRHNGFFQRELAGYFWSKINAATDAGYMLEDVELFLNAQELEQLVIETDDEDLANLLDRVEFEEAVQEKLESIDARVSDLSQSGAFSRLIQGQQQDESQKLNDLMHSTSALAPVIGSDYMRDMWTRYHYTERNESPMEGLSKEYGVFLAVMDVYARDEHIPTIRMEAIAQEFYSLIALSDKMVGTMQDASEKAKLNAHIGGLMADNRETFKNASIAGVAIADRHLPDEYQDVLGTFEKSLHQGGSATGEMAAATVDTTLDFTMDVVNFIKESPKVAATFVGLATTLYIMNNGGDAETAQQAANDVVMLFGEEGLEEAAIDYDALPEEAKQVQNWHWDMGPLGLYKHYMYDNAVVGPAQTMMDWMRMGVHYSYEMVGLPIDGNAAFSQAAESVVEPLATQLFNVNLFQNASHAAFWMYMTSKGYQHGLRGAQKVFDLLAPLTDLGYQSGVGTMELLHLKKKTDLSERLLQVAQNIQDTDFRKYQGRLGIEQQSARQLSAEDRRMAVLLPVACQAEGYGFNATKGCVLLALAEAATDRESLTPDIPVKSITGEKTGGNVISIGGLKEEFQIEAKTMGQTLKALDRFDMIMIQAASKIGTDQSWYLNFMQQKIDESRKALADYSADGNINILQKKLSRNLEDLMAVEVRMTEKSGIYETVFGKEIDEEKSKKLLGKANTQYGRLKRSHRLDELREQISADKEGITLTDQAKTRSLIFANHLWNGMVEGARVVGKAGKAVTNKPTAIALAGMTAAAVGIDMAGGDNSIVDAIATGAGGAISSAVTTVTFLLYNFWEDVLGVHVGSGAMLLGAGAATGYAYKKMIKPSARSATEAIHDALGFDLANAWQKFSEGITNTTDDIGERMDRLNKRMGEHLPRYSRSHRDDEDGDGSAGAHEEYKEDVTADYCRGCPLKSQQGSANNMDL